MTWSNNDKSYRVGSSSWLLKETRGALELCGQKKARGKNDDLGEVKQVTQDYVLIEKGIINKEKVIHSTLISPC